MKNIYLVTWTKTPAKLQGEGGMVRKRLIPKSDRVTLYAFARWLVSSRRGLGQLRQANTNVS